MVPEGSVLFQGHTNDLSQTLTPNLSLYADDGIIYKSIQSMGYICGLQRDFDTVVRWYKNAKCI